MNDEMVKVEKVVFKEENGRVYEVKIGLRLSKMFLEDLCKEILDNLYHLEEKPTYSFTTLD